MQRKLVREFAAEVAQEIQRLRSPDPLFRKDLTLLDMYLTEDLAVTQLENELRKILAKSSSGVSGNKEDYFIGDQEVSFENLQFFINYLKRFETVINGVYADRERKSTERLAASKNNNNKAEELSLEAVHKQESLPLMGRITDSDYPSVPTSLMTRVNAMLATHLHADLVLNAPRNAETRGYRLPIDFLYSGFPSQYPHVPDVGLSFNSFMTTECGRPLVILACLDEFRDRLAANPQESVFLKHTSYTAEECKKFTGGSQPKLTQAERIKLFQHSKEVEDYYNGIISVIPEESQEIKKTRLASLRAALVARMNQPDFQPGYRVGSEKANLDDAALEKLQQTKPSAYRLLANGFLQAFNIANVNDLAELLEEIQLHHWPSFLECINYQVLSSLLLPKVKIDGEYCPDFDLLKMENAARFGSFLERGIYHVYVAGEPREVRFWDARKELHDRAVQVLYAMLLKYKRQMEPEGNGYDKNLKVQTLEKYIECLCTCVKLDPDPKVADYKPKYCMNQFPLFLENGEKACLGPSENNRVKELVASGARRHDAKEKTAKPLSASFDAAEVQVMDIPDVYNDDQINFDIDRLVAEPGRADHWKDHLDRLFSPMRLLRLSSYLSNKSAQSKSSLTGIAFFDKAIDKFNADPFVQLFESLSFYKSGSDLRNDAALAYFVKLYIHIRSGEAPEGKQVKLDAANLLLEMLCSGDQFNDITSYISKHEKLDMKQKEVMLACFKEGATYNDRLTKLGLMAAKIRRPETFMPKAAQVKAEPKSAWSSWFGN